MSEHFGKNEMSCKCCGLNLCTARLYETLEDIREYVGRPLYINSAYRCSKHNKKVGGRRSSAHLYGLAADIRINRSSNERFELVLAALRAGVNRVGVGQEFVHIDVNEGAPQRVLWLY